MNPSISRKHAAICHGVPPGLEGAETGSATLLDLKTGNGTFYAKRYPCRGQYKTRVAAGSGIVLKEGMCFRFGESSRSFVVRGMSAATAKRQGNPNFSKGVDARDIAISRDLGLSDGSEKKKHKTGSVIHRNPFREDTSSVNTTNLMLPTLNAAVAPKIVEGATTFSFHNRKQLEKDQIRFEREHLNRKRIQEELRKAQGTAIPQPVAHKRAGK